MSRIKILFKIIAFLAFFSKSQGYGIFNISLIKDVVSVDNSLLGISDDVSNLALTPAEIIQLPLSVFVGLPSSVVSEVVDNLCDLALGIDIIESQVKPNAAELNLELRTACESFSIPLLQAEELLDLPQFNSSKPTVIVVSGWTTDINNSELIDLSAKAFACRDDHNFLALDTSNFIQTLYTWSALNTQQIGEYLADALVKLSSQISLDGFHLIGHSLGAQIVGYAGRYYKELTNTTLKHITGLDPAKPCFKEGHDLAPIGRGVAEYVDIIHSNPGTLGILESIGDLDYYANGYSSIQPGCLGISCSHSRSYIYYIETIYPNNENDFLAAQCSSLLALKLGSCNGPTYPMGFRVPLGLKGNYFSKINPREPYGTNAQADYESPDNDCGVCPED